MSAYRSRKGAKAPTSASQRKRRAAPENRAGRENSSERRKSEGRARFGAGALVGDGGDGPVLFGCEPMEAATV